MGRYWYKDIMAWQAENEYHSQILHLMVDLQEIQVYEENIPELLECILRVYNDMLERYVVYTPESEI